MPRAPAVCKCGAAPRRVGWRAGPPRRSGGSPAAGSDGGGGVEERGGGEELDGLVGVPEVELRAGCGENAGACKVAGVEVHRHSEGHAAARRGDRERWRPVGNMPYEAPSPAGGPWASPAACRPVVRPGEGASMGPSGIVGEHFRTKCSPPGTRKKQKMKVSHGHEMCPGDRPPRRRPDTSENAFRSSPLDRARMCTGAQRPKSSPKKAPTICENRRVASAEMRDE